MAKPICIIYLNEYFDLGYRRRDAPMEFMRALNGNFGEDDNNVQHTDYWQDYYWFCFYKPEITEPEFKVYYEKDFTEIQYEELKKLIQDSIDKFDIENHEQKIGTLPPLTAK